jgi:predicted nucleic acid-binding protein
MNIISVDANVIAKTIINEFDSDEAIEFLRECVSKKVVLIAPELIQYEVIQAVAKNKYPISKALKIFDSEISNLIEMKRPHHYEWLQAEKICKTGHVKSGYPSIYDSLYHAMAIVEDGVFITADKRHYEKSKEYGHIALLENWRETLDFL